MGYSETRLVPYSLWVCRRRNRTCLVLGVGTCELEGTRSVFYRDVAAGTCHYRNIREFLDGSFIPAEEAMALGR